MRPLRCAAATLALGACLSAPTGRDPGAIDAPVDADHDGPGVAWPPPSADIAAVASGDLDGDGIDDLIAADITSQRVYWLRGGVDLHPTSAAVTTATASAELAGLQRPVAMAVVELGAARFVVVLDSPASGGPRVTVFDMTLTQRGTNRITGSPTPAPADVISVNRSTFGPDMDATFLTLPDAVVFIEGDALVTATPAILGLPPPGGGFDDVVLATGYVGAPPMPRVAVSQARQAHRADATGPGQFDWTAVRSGGVDWTAQLVADLDGDGYPDVLAFDPNTVDDALLCGLDVQGQALPTCYQTRFGMNSARMVAGPLVAIGQTDVLLTDIRPGQQLTSVFVAGRVRIAGGAVVADFDSPPLDTNLPEGLPAILQLDTGPSEIVVMGKDGAVLCARPTGSMNRPEPCPQ
jgi:hypothetical protein